MFRWVEQGECLSRFGHDIATKYEGRCFEIVQSPA